MRSDASRFVVLIPVPGQDRHRHPIAKSRQRMVLKDLMKVDAHSVPLLNDPRNKAPRSSS